MLDWKDETNTFSEERRHWKGRYLEICEIAGDSIECNLYSCEDDDWEIFVIYGNMDGVSYVSKEKAVAQREQMKKDIEEEYGKNGDEPSDDFIDSFARKYQVDPFAYF